MIRTIAMFVLFCIPYSLHAQTAAKCTRAGLQGSVDKYLEAGHTYIPAGKWENPVCSHPDRMQSSRLRASFAKRESQNPIVLFILY